MVCCIAAIARLAIAVSMTAGVIGCNPGDLYVYRDGRRPPGEMPPGGDTPAMQREPLATAAQIFVFLQSSTWRMEADTIPSHPNGYDENINYGQATQCLHR